MGVSPWGALRLRATTFLPADAEIDGGSIWSRVLGTAPDEEQRRPREGLLQQIGTLGEFVVVFRLGHPRVDWFLQSKGEPPTPVPPSPEFTPIPLNEALNSLRTIAANWFSIQSTVSRIAFGANLVQPAINVQDALSRLAYSLPDIKIDPDNSSDFFYQINRPRDARSIEGLRINRLSKWSVMAQVTGQLVVQSSPGAEQQASMSPMAQRYASSLELDINTAADYLNGIEQTHATILFNELTELGKEIVERGDVP